MNGFALDGHGQTLSPPALDPFYGALRRAVNVASGKFQLVRGLLSKLAAVLVTACACLCAVVGAAHAQIAFTPCGDSNDFACGHLNVPLDPTGATPGTVTLALRRHRAPVGEPRSAIIALAGGPGQPALPFSEQFAELLGPIASTRDLIVFDQRGIGLSQPLSCHAFERPGLFRSFGALIEACSSQLGAGRAFYKTANTVADIEAIRVAGGYEKLVLYGTSYGTKVAEQYAQAYPSHVEALVLDSVVPPNGPEAFSRSTFAAVPRVLRQICAGGACAHVTREPVADLAKVVAQMRRAPLRARAIDGHGKAHALSISSDELVALLLAGDFSQLLRAEFVTALSSAAQGDTAPLGRVVAAVGSGEGEEHEDFDTPLYYATSCEDEAFPFSRAASASARVAEASAAARALPPAALAPFTTANALDLSDIPACAGWTYTTPAPPPSDAPLPNVPTLIVSGADDLRTPTSNAREVAAQIPDANLLVVPYTGHSVLSDEPTPCAREALQALFTSVQIEPCRASPPPPGLRPPPRAPVSVDLVSPMRGYPRTVGRTLGALGLTFADFVRQLVLQLGASENVRSAASLRLGGLRAGWAALVGRKFTFTGYSYVPGVSISGILGAESASLRIGGSAASAGTLRLKRGNTLVGTLGSVHVHLDLATPQASAAIVGVDAQESSHSAGGGSFVDAGARRLARLLGSLFGAQLHPVR